MLQSKILGNESLIELGNLVNANSDGLNEIIKVKTVHVDKETECDDTIELSMEIE